jgi:hypothetical protein
MPVILRPLENKQQEGSHLQAMKKGLTQPLIL